MKRLRPHAVLLLLLCLAGCQQASPIERTIQARQAYTLTLESLNLLHRHGYFSTEEKVKVEPFRKAAAVALDDMEAAALAGGTNNAFSPFSEAARAFATALQELVRAQNEAAKVKAAVERHEATTKPG